MSATRPPFTALESAALDAARDLLRQGHTRSTALLHLQMAIDHAVSVAERELAPREEGRR